MFRLVTPILLYGAEVWGIYGIKNIDRIHIKFCKSILGVRQQTLNSAVRIVGRYPFLVICKKTALNVWIRILKHSLFAFIRGLYLVAVTFD